MSDELEITARRKNEFYTLMQKKTLDLIRQGEIYLNHAPRHEKYSLCQKIRQTQLEIDMLIIEAKKRYWNKTSLTKLDVTHEQLRHLWRIFYELGYFDYRRQKKEENPGEALRRFTTINIIINELGSMIGGIIKNAKVQQKES